jgi:polysaccharide pyruvyl transferase CsaB
LAYPRKSFHGIRAAFQDAEGFIWGGGSLMQDATSWLNPVYYGGLMQLAQRQGLKTIAWAQGIGPLRHPWTRWLTQRTLMGCDGVTVRDLASAELAAAWGIPVWMAPDPVWALESAPIHELSDFPSPRVAVALRWHPYLTEQRLEQLTKSLANFQTATGTGLLLLPFQPIKDLPIAKQIQPYLPGPNQILIEQNPRKLKGIFRSVEMAIAMRLHGLIMAAAEGCRCFALSYDPKVTFLADDLQMHGWQMMPSHLTSPSTADSLLTWPDTTAAMTQQLIDCYANGEALSPDQIQSRVDRAFIHQEILHHLLTVIYDS